MKKKNQILSDHKLVKKKLQPPLFHAFPGWEVHFKEVSYLNEVLPELIWQGFLNEKYGVPVASKISMKLLNTINSVISFEKDRLFCFISNFDSLTEKEIDSILVKVFLDNDFQKIISALLPFMRMFPDCPLRVLFYHSISEPTSEDISYVKSVLDPLLDKTSKASTFVLSNIIYYAILLDKFQVNPESEFLRLKEIEFYPTTEESQIIASLVRGAINPIVKKWTMTEASKKWSDCFWNQAYKFEPYNIDDLYFE